MSYDLYFKGRKAKLDALKFKEYFEAEPFFYFENNQAFYQNEDTGVYFHFEYCIDNESEYESVFIINYFRPSFFIKEAEPIINKFVLHLDLLVSDPQVNGMGDGEYDRSGVTNGWIHGNKSAYESIISAQKGKNQFFHMPTEKLEHLWQWNFNRDRLQNEEQKGRFVPKIMIMNIGGIPSTVVVWPDGVPITIPAVDYIYLKRDRLAPKNLLLKKDSRPTYTPLSDALSILMKYSSQDSSGVIRTEYFQPPKEIEQFIRKMPIREIQGMIAMDSILNSELIP